MPKRKRYDFANKPDPETGEPRRFCTGCEAYLPFDRFYPCHLKGGQLMCKVHSNARNKPFGRIWYQNKYGDARSIARMRVNLNLWIWRQRQGWAKWSEEDVEQALQLHGVDLQTETRRVRFRPKNRSLPFTVDNSIVEFSNKNRKTTT